MADTEVETIDLCSQDSVDLAGDTQDDFSANSGVSVVAGINATGTDAPFCEIDLTGVGSVTGGTVPAVRAVAGDSAAASRSIQILIRGQTRKLSWVGAPSKEWLASKVRELGGLGEDQEFQLLDEDGDPVVLKSSIAGKRFSLLDNVAHADLKDFPEHWSCASELEAYLAGRSDEPSVVEVERGSPEWRDVTDKLTDAKFQCERVQRNESPLLWRRFQLERQMMEAKGRAMWGGAIALECALFPSAMNCN
eukprot:SAG11_NODE_20_length_25330_cov_18.348143_6_plen_250_part_00